MVMNRRWVLPGPNQALVREDGPVPKAPEKGYLIKIRRAGICGYDAESLTNESTEGNPHVLGHEFCGEVVEIGEQATGVREDVAIGTLVSIYPFTFLDDCPSCQSDCATLCEYEPPHLGYGFEVDGGFADYVRILNTKDVFPVPSGVSLEEAAIAGCVGITAYGVAKELTDSVERIIRHKRKAKVFVIGVGAVSLTTVQFIRHFWGDNVTICTISSKGSRTEKEKLALGKEFGADITLTWERGGSTEDAVAMVKEQAGTFDGVCDFISSEDSAKRILPLLNKGATWQMLGTTGGNVSIPQTDILWNEIRIQGHIGSNRGSLTEVLQLVADKKIKTVPITTFEFDKLPEAVEEVGKSRIIGRAVINHD